MSSEVFSVIKSMKECLVPLISPDTDVIEEDISEENGDVDDTCSNDDKDETENTINLNFEADSYNTFFSSC